LIEVFSFKSNENTNKLVTEIAAWITANRDTPLKADQISKHFGYNADYISRLFKAHYGKSLKEYMSNVKIDYIKQLLLTSELPLSDVAYNAGFYDYKYFLKFFKYHEGITPTQFLKAYPKTHINKK
jgi:YesN/AraC family two-component response regulator